MCQNSRNQEIKSCSILRVKLCKAVDSLFLSLSVRFRILSISYNNHSNSITVSTQYIPELWHQTDLDFFATFSLFFCSFLSMASLNFPPFLFLHCTLYLYEIYIYRIAILFVVLCYRIPPPPPNPPIIFYIYSKYI